MIYSNTYHKQVCSGPSQKVHRSLMRWTKFRWKAPPCPVLDLQYIPAPRIDPLTKSTKLTNVSAKIHSGHTYIFSWDFLPAHNSWLQSVCHDLSTEWWNALTVTFSKRKVYNKWLVRFEIINIFSWLVSWYRENLIWYSTFEIFGSKSMCFMKFKSMMSCLQWWRLNNESPISNCHCRIRERGRQ